MKKKKKKIFSGGNIKNLTLENLSFYKLNPWSLGREIFCIISGQFLRFSWKITKFVNFLQQIPKIKKDPKTCSSRNRNKSSWGLFTKHTSQIIDKNHKIHFQRHLNETETFICMSCYQRKWPHFLISADFIQGL